MNKIELEQLNGIELFISVLAILNEKSMTENEVKKIIYANEHNACKVDDETLFIIFAKLFDSNHIELEKVEQGESLLKITERGKNGLKQIMDVISEKTKEQG